MSDVRMSDVREQLADYAHAAWSSWMTYLFDKCEYNADGTATLPAWAVRRWQRQAGTPYAQLPEPEKESDREEADRMLAIVARGPRPCPAAGGARGGGMSDENLFYRPVEEPKPRAPHRCPVCGGRGLVPSGYYLGVSRTVTTGGTAPEPCRTCGGRGLIWEPRP